jgi:hypothetical protein
MIAQEFQKSYSLGRRSISIHNVSGDIRVTGYDGEDPGKGFRKERIVIESRLTTEARAIMWS